MIGRGGRDAVTGGPRSRPLGKDADVAGAFKEAADGPNGDSVLEGVANALWATGPGDFDRIGLEMVIEPVLRADMLRDMADGFLDRIFGVLDREPPMVRTSAESSVGFKSSLIMTRVNRTIVSLFEAISWPHCELNLSASHASDTKSRHWGLRGSWLRGCETARQTGGAILTRCNGAGPTLHSPEQCPCISSLSTHQRALAASSWFWL